MSQKCVIMVSSSAGDQGREVQQRRLITLLETRKIDFETIDGADPAVKEVRDMLFGVSSLRGKYPQCFLRAADDSYTFVGDWDTIESLVESDSIPAEILEANPTIPTFSKTFADAKTVE